MKDPALCELFDGGATFLVGVNFMNKSLMSCVYYIYLVVVDLKFILYRYKTRVVMLAKIIWRSL